MAKFYLPVCSENLVKLLTYGLISADRTKPLSGRNPFVPDALSGFSGEIPLFVNKVPPEEIEKIKDIDKYLHACVLDIDIKKIINGSFRTSLNTSGSFPLSKPGTDLDKDVQWISITGPIPVTLINAFYFSDKEAEEDFLSNLKSSNVTLPENIKLWKTNLFASEKYEENLLDEYQTQEAPSAETTRPELTDKHWHKLSAYGGALALAFSASKNGQESSDKFKELASRDYVKSGEVSQWNAGNDFSFICDFLLSDPGQSEYDASDFKIQLYSGILNTLCSADEGSATKEIVHFLTSGAFEDFGEKFERFANSIAEDINCIHQTQYTVKPSEHLSLIRNDIVNNKKTSSLSLGLAMLAFKDSAEKIIDYHQDDFEESDIFYFALLAGMRAGLHRIPEWIRNIDGMNDFVSTRMSRMAHHIIGSDLQFKEAPAPKTLIDLITKSTGFDFPLWLIDQLKIDQCITSTIKTKDGHSVRKDGSIVISGPLKLNLELDDIKYTKHMTETKSRDIPYNGIYKKLARR